jgi:hypothetical protein
MMPGPAVARALAMAGIMMRKRPQHGTLGPGHLGEVGQEALAGGARFWPKQSIIQAIRLKFGCSKSRPLWDLARALARKVRGRLDQDTALLRRSGARWHAAGIRARSMPAIPAEA